MSDKILGSNMQPLSELTPEGLIGDLVMAWNAQLVHQGAEEQAKRYTALFYETLGRLAAYGELRHQVTKLRRTNEEEVAEFNAGFDAYKAHVPYECAPASVNDQWSVGWAWAAFEDLRKQNAKLRDLLGQANQFSTSGDFGIEHAIECAILHEGDCNCGFNKWRDAVEAVLAEAERWS